MGNKSSTSVSQSTKMSSGDESLEVEHQPELYSIIDGKDKSKGELVELTRKALYKNNYDQVNEYIRTRIPEFLLNEGKGDVVNKI
jgi:hypothetical protein